MAPKGLVFSFAREGGRGRVRAGELARASDAVGGACGSAALLELFRPGRPDPVLERREVPEEQ